MIARRTIKLSQDSLDRFSQYFYRMKAFLVHRWSIWTSFSDISRDVTMATNLVKNDKLPSFDALAFRNWMGYRYLNVCLNNVSCKNFVNFSSSLLIWAKLSEIYWTDFHEFFSPNGRYFFEDYWPHLFFDFSMDVAMATNFGKIGDIPKWIRMSQFQLTNITWEYFCYILCKFHQDRSSNQIARVTTAPFGRKGKNRHTPPNISVNANLHSSALVDTCMEIIKLT